jgi:uncharacterized protein (TIGR03435 family)
MSSRSATFSRSRSRVRAGVVIATALTALDSPLAAQGEEMPRFEVASIREAVTIRGRGIMFLPGGQFRATGVSLRDLIKRAWNLQEDQIAGGPDWMSKDLYDITAKAPSIGAEPTPAQWLLVKALLADRFGLRVHEETRELPVYALVRKSANSGLGARMRRSTTDCEAFRRTIAEAQKGGVAVELPAARCGFGVRTTGELTTLDIGAATMPQLANYLTPFAGRMVIDRTAIDGQFDVELDVSTAALRRLAGSAPQAPTAGGDEPSLFTSVQEQLGLKLEPVKAPVRVLVIDAAARPTPN